MTGKVVVVYQFGKVGSTSLVAALNTVEGVEAYQCHFLGETAYSSVIRSVLNGDLSQYFMRHELGQLVQNIEAETTLLTCERRGGETYVLSIAREPIEWYRSALLQDLEGTLEQFVAFAEYRNEAHRPISFVTDVIREEVKHLLQDAVNEERLFRSSLLQARREYLAAEYGSFAPLLRQQLAIFLRPLTWFEEHYGVYTGLKVELDDTGVFASQCGARRYLVTRYEDLYRLGEQIEKRWGITLPAMPRENASGDKRGADRVKHAFEAWKVDKKLQALLSETQYVRAFRYAGA